MVGETYQGFKNRETWATSLHLNNDQALQELMNDLADESDDIYELAEKIQSFVEQIIDDVMEGDYPRDAKLMVRDIGSVWRVDWVEVATVHWDDKLYRQNQKL